MKMNDVYVLHFILFRKLFILNVTISSDRVGNESIAVSQYVFARDRIQGAHRISCESPLGLYRALGALGAASPAAASD